MKKYLVYYYTVIQFIHFLANFAVLFINRDFFLNQISANFTETQKDILLFSSIIDFFIASPAALIFFVGYLKDAKWKNLFIDISLNTAMISAIYYNFILYKFDALDFSFLKAFIAIAFIPVLILYFFYFSHRIKGKYLV
jgi:hypothetical protein